MARAGIRYLDVAQAATTLKEAGIYPSIDAVRQRLGSGSNSTISRLLREWREKQGNQLELEQGIPESLLLAVKGLYQHLQAEAERTLKEQETTTQQLKTDWQAQLAKLENQYHQAVQTQQSLETTLTTCQAETVSLQQELRKTQEALHEQAREKDLLLERLNDKKAEIARLDQQVRHAQDNLVHYRETTRQEREIEIRRHEKESNALIMEVKQHQTLQTQLKEKNAMLSQELHHLQQEKKQSVSDAAAVKQQCEQLQQLTASQKSEFNALNQAHQQLVSRHAECKDQYHHCEQEAIQLRLNLENAQGRITELETAAKKAENALAKASHDNLFLTQEKTELATQLKQWQTRQGQETVA